ncbi:hypothetical protein [Actinocorallia longicatena]|uniref:MinD-like ATPase involved in chromosome partitioning or flagellar assembly n=1 Tax=Actinocorallia longicatena TaxID=111803 RepID=A0ABP6QNF0_9ACTN
MALIALAADKGAPGVTTAAVALGAVWPRPVLVAECDLAGGDLVHRLPGEQGLLDPGKGLLSLATSARRGLRPEQIAPHTQRLNGGLDVLVGLTNAEQAAGMTWLWNPLGRSFAILPGVDVIADCGRLGPHTALVDLLREADMVVLVTHASVDHVAHLRERIAALSADLPKQRAHLGVIVIADPRGFRDAISEVERIIVAAKLPATVLGGLAFDPKGAHMLRGPWGGRLDKSLLIRSARELAVNLLRRPVLESRNVPAGPPRHPTVTSAPPPRAQTGPQPVQRPAQGAPPIGSRGQAPQGSGHAVPPSGPHTGPQQVLGEPPRGR